MSNPTDFDIKRVRYNGFITGEFASKHPSTVTPEQKAWREKRARIEDRAEAKRLLKELDDEWN